MSTQGYYPGCEEARKKIVATPPVEKKEVVFKGSVGKRNLNVTVTRKRPPFPIPMGLEW